MNIWYELQEERQLKNIFHKYMQYIIDFSEPAKQGFCKSTNGKIVIVYIIQLLYVNFILE